MEAISGLALGLGIILGLVGSIWIIVNAFKDSILWGLLCLLISPIQLVYAFMNLDTCKKPLGILVVGVVLYVVGTVVLVGEAMENQGGETTPAMTGDE